MTAKTRLPKSVLNAAYTGAWAVDIEADGDLDIVLGQTTGLPTVLRNNGDGTFYRHPSLSRESPAYASLFGPTLMETAIPMPPFSTAQDIYMSFSISVPGDSLKCLCPPSSLRPKRLPQLT